jgi:type 1 glutamine amidotransferase
MLNKGIRKMTITKLQISTYVLMQRLFASSLVVIGLLVIPVIGYAAPENDRFIDGRKHILFIGHSKYYDHDSVSKAMYTMSKLGVESELFDVTFRTDFKLVTKQEIPQYLNAKNLDFFDAVMLFTQGELLLDEQQRADLISFVRDDGKGLLVAHSGIDFNTWQFKPEGGMFVKDTGGWEELIELVGGVFINHPWREEVVINVEDREFPATRHFSNSFEIEDEIYQLIHFSREKVRVLMSLDTTSVDMESPTLAPVVRDDGDFALAFVHEYGKGRVFVSPLGHIMGSWDRPDFQKMWLEGAKWAMGLSEGDATPRPRTLGEQ